MTDLGSIGGDGAVAYDVNSNGDVVVGWAATTSGNEHAFRWTAAGMTDLGTLPGGFRSQANAVDSTGSTVVGWSQLSNGAQQHAFRWTSGGGMSDLGTLDPTNFGAVSVANDVSGDGSVVVGWSNAPTTGARAFRWTATTGMQKSKHASVQRRNQYDGKSRLLSPMLYPAKAISSLVRQTLQAHPTTHSWCAMMTGQSRKALSSLA
jgi:probable HAF family extracellular repeat protein